MPSEIAWKRNFSQPVVLAIAALLAVYLLSTALGWTAADNQADAHGAAPVDKQPEAVEHATRNPPDANKQDHAADRVASPLAVLPFITLLACIAVLPLVSATSHWWEHNRNKLLVAVVAGLITLTYLAFWHPSAGLGLAWQTFLHVVAKDYVPFMVLLFSLYTISGGIRIQGDLPAHALTNTLLLAAGGLLASLIGTTGAAMLLVRPLLETNGQRKHVAHTVVFFIFVAANCGGLLLPIGDPPLFLGYLNGVDFLWTLTLWRSWLFVNGVLLAIYFLVDQFYFYPLEAKADIARDELQVRSFRFLGLMPNALLLVGVVLSVALLDPGKTFPGTSWHPWLYLREAVQMALVLVSLVLGSPAVRELNRFNYVAILEVAALFIGIFVAMQPALEILRVRGGSLGIDSPQKFFWASGWLSSVLDNAPTYLVFFHAAATIPMPDVPKVAGVAEPLLVAISLGSVTMGAMTYIGNGPNFMVKAIAEQAGIKMPSFFGYLLISCLVLLPILAINSWLFLP